MWAVFPVAMVNGVVKGPNSSETFERAYNGSCTLRVCSSSFCLTEAKTPGKISSEQRRSFNSNSWRSFCSTLGRITVEKEQYGGLQGVAIQNKQKCTSKNLLHTDAAWEAVPSVVFGIQKNLSMASCPATNHFLHILAAHCFFSVLWH